MRKIHVTRQFFEASGRHGDLIEKTKNPFLDKVNGSMCAKFQVCIVVSVARRRDTNKYINTQTHTYTSEFKNIPGGCSPHVDFDKISFLICHVTYQIKPLNLLNTFLSFLVQNTRI